MEAQTEYIQLCRQLDALLTDEMDAIANLANASALIYMHLKDINWAGFYLLKNEELILGPFQGKPACMHIPIGKGVCGTCAANGSIQRISDVHSFVGHIACDTDSNSEIVLPIYKEGKLYAVLDIDSPLYHRFHKADEIGLQNFVKILEQHL